MKRTIVEEPAFHIHWDDLPVDIRMEIIKADVRGATLLAQTSKKVYRETYMVVADYRGLFEVESWKCKIWFEPYSLRESKLTRFVRCSQSGGAIRLLLPCAKTIIIRYDTVSQVTSISVKPSIGLMKTTVHTLKRLMDAYCSFYVGASYDTTTYEEALNAIFNNCIFDRTFTWRW